MKKKTKESIANICVVFGAVLMITLIVQNWLNSSQTIVIHAKEEAVGAVISIVPPTATLTPSPTVTAVSEIGEGDTEDVKELIKEVFGEHSDKAFKLLECENGSLNPEAVNQNYDSNKTRDLGLFQINSYWQGIRHDGKAEQFLFDPAINTQIAYRLFVDSGYSFKMWTCGRELGI
jgi:hypothetical protein